MGTDLNHQISLFVKKVSLNVQREIEQSIVDALETQQLTGNETLSVKVTLSLPDLDLQHHVSGFIALK